MPRSRALPLYELLNETRFQLHASKDVPCGKNWIVEGKSGLKTMPREKIEAKNEQTMRLIESKYQQMHTESKTLGSNVSQRPRSNSCNVCRRYIEGDFSEHVKSDPAHLTKLKNDPHYGLIDQEMRDLTERNQRKEELPVFERNASDSGISDDMSDIDDWQNLVPMKVQPRPPRRAPMP